MQLSPASSDTKVEVRRNFISPLNFELRNVSCSNLDEYLSEAYKHYIRLLETILLERGYFKVGICFLGVYGESRLDQDREIEHYLDHKTADKWVYDIRDIEDCYNSFTEGVHREIANNLPAETYNYSLESWVTIEDLDDDLE